MSLSAGVAWIKRVLHFDVEAALARMRRTPQAAAPARAAPAAPAPARAAPAAPRRRRAAAPPPPPPEPTVYDTDLPLVPQDAPAPARRTFAAVDTRSTKTGMKTKRVGDEYAGEHNKFGWRAANDPAVAENTSITTKLFSDKEQADNTLAPGPDGTFSRGDGGSVANKTSNFTMDETGRMVGFEAVADVSRRAKGKRPASTRTTKAAEAWQIKAKHPKAEIAMAHHSSALGGEAVTDEQGQPVLDAKGRPMMRSKPAALAGSVSFDDQGRIIEITNLSGHYKPDVDFLIQGVEHLLKQGAFFDGEVLGPDGQALPKDDPRHKLHEAGQKKLQARAGLLDRIQQTTAHIQQATEAAAEGDKDAREELETLDMDLRALRKELTALTADVTKIQDTLRRAGVAPSQKMRGADGDEPAPQVSFLGGDIGQMQGRDIATKKREDLSRMDVTTFLRSGGGSVNPRTGRANLEHKEEALSMLRGDEDLPAGASGMDERIAGSQRTTREALDREAEQRGERVAKEVAELTAKKEERQKKKAEAKGEKEKEKEKEKEAEGEPEQAAAAPPPTVPDAAEIAALLAEMAPLPEAAPAAGPGDSSESGEPDRLAGEGKGKSKSAAPLIPPVYSDVADRTGGRGKGKGKGKGKKKGAPTPAAEPDDAGEAMETYTLSAEGEGKDTAPVISPVYAEVPTGNGAGRRSKGKGKGKNVGARATEPAEPAETAEGLSTYTIPPTTAPAKPKRRGKH